MKAVSILLALLIVLLTTLRTAGQDDCAFDLEAVRLILNEAETWYNAGESDRAFDLIRKAETELQLLRSACNIVELTETLSVSGGMFTFAYPEGWASDIQESSTPQQPTIVLLTSNAELLENINEPMPSLKSGEQAVGLLFIQPEALSSMFNQASEFEKSAEGIAKALSEQMTEGFMAGETKTLSINDRRAARLTFSGSSFEAITYVIEFRREEVYAVVVALSAPGEGGLMEKLALEMTEMIRYDSSIVPTPAFIPSPVPTLTPIG